MNLTRLQWTYSAILCHALYGNCKKCPIQEIMETRCMMYYVIRQLYKTIGYPTEADCSRVGVDYGQLQRIREKAAILED